MMRWTEGTDDSFIFTYISPTHDAAVYTNWTIATYLLIRRTKYTPAQRIRDFVLCHSDSCHLADYLVRHFSFSFIIATNSRAVIPLSYAAMEKKDWN